MEEPREARAPATHLHPRESLPRIANSMRNQSNHNKNETHYGVAWNPVDLGIEDRNLRVEMFTVCDGAAEQDGRLSIVGTYETVFAASFPIVIPQMMVVLRLRFWPHEGCNHVVRLFLTNPDGRRTQVMETSMTLHPQDEERSSAYNLLANVQNTWIGEPGEYAFDFILNGQLEGRLPLCFRRRVSP